MCQRLQELRDFAAELIKQARDAVQATLLGDLLDLLDSLFDKLRLYEQEKLRLRPCKPFNQTAGNKAGKTRTLVSLNKTL